MDVLSFKGVNKSFKKIKILEDISLSIKKGDSVGIVGRSGSGKSVLIKIMIGFLKPDSGKILTSNGYENNVGFSMQNNSLYDNLTVKQNLNYFSKLYKIPRKRRKIIIPPIIERLDLKGFENTTVKKLSGGTKKRVDLGCSLLSDPEILVLDEPFLGLDPELMVKLQKFILELNKRGKTVIISSHRINELKEICSRFLLIKDKKLAPVEKDKLIEAYK